MINNTLPFIQNNKLKLRTGYTLPENSINIAYYSSQKPSANENIVVGDNSGSIYENINQQQKCSMYCNKDYTLMIDDVTDVASNFVSITNVFKDDTPLYYFYKFKMKCINTDEKFIDTNLILTDPNGNILPNDFKYVFKIKHSIGVLYDLYVYTSFQVSSTFKVKCVYNAVDIKNGKIEAISGYEEYIYPTTLFSKSNNVVDAIQNKNIYCIKKIPDSINSSKIYVNGVTKDTRTPVKLSLESKITFEDNTTQILEAGSETYPILLYNYKSALISEKKNFTNNKQIINTVTPKELCGSNKQIISIEHTITYCNCDKNLVTISSNPDGTGLIYAETEHDTGVIDNTSNKYCITKDGYIHDRFSVEFKDRKAIKLLAPSSNNILDSWYIRIQNGKFIVNKDGFDCYYFLPEYYNQKFNENYKQPYMDILKEEVMKLSSSVIKVSNYPILDNVNEVKIYKIINGNKTNFKIKNLNCIDGTIELFDKIDDNEPIYADYIYEESNYIYRGYNKFVDKKDAHILLDCNPNKQHSFTMIDEDDIFDSPSFSLIDKKIFIYIKPAIIKSNGNIIVYETDVLFHTFKEINDKEVNDNNLILLGTVYVRPNSSYENLVLIDSRVRGGGINKNSNLELEPESEFYCDIGNIDGKPFNSNNVIVIKLNKQILEKHHPSYVENVINKHLALGSLPIIEYVETVGDDEFNIKNLIVNTIITNKLNIKPEFGLSITKESKPILLSLTKTEPIKPEFNLSKEI